MSGKKIIVFQPRDVTTCFPGKGSERLAAEVFLDTVIAMHPELHQGKTAFYPFVEKYGGYTEACLQHINGLTGANHTRVTKYAGIIYVRRMDPASGDASYQVREEECCRILRAIAAKHNLCFQGRSLGGRIETTDPTNEAYETILRIGLDHIYTKPSELLGEADIKARNTELFELLEKLKPEIREPETRVLLNLDNFTFMRIVAPYLKREGYEFEEKTC